MVSDIFSKIVTAGDNSPPVIRKSGNREWGFRVQAGGDQVVFGVVCNDALVPGTEISFSNFELAQLHLCRKDDNARIHNKNGRISIALGALVKEFEEAPAPPMVDLRRIYHWDHHAAARSESGLAQNIQALHDRYPLTASPSAFMDAVRALLSPSGDQVASLDGVVRGLENLALLRRIEMFVEKAVAELKAKNPVDEIPTSLIAMAEEDRLRARAMSEYTDFEWRWGGDTLDSRSLHGAGCGQPAEPQGVAVLTLRRPYYDSDRGKNYYFGDVYVDSATFGIDALRAWEDPPPVVQAAIRAYDEEMEKRKRWLSRKPVTPVDTMRSEQAHLASFIRALYAEEAPVPPKKPSLLRRLGDACFGDLTNAGPAPK